MHLIGTSDIFLAPPPSQHVAQVEKSETISKDTKEGLCCVYQSQVWHFLTIGLATVNSWNGGFVGNSAKLFEDILKEYMKVNDAYARYVPVIQSSGTGKSKTQDELAKTILYIPICLASENAHGAYLGL